MNREYWNTAIAALAALLLTLTVLMFVARNPWMLIGVAAVLWAIAAIVRAINGTPDLERGAEHSSCNRDKKDEVHDNKDVDGAGNQSNRSG